MVGTITTDLQDVDLAEATTAWLSLGTWGAAFAATPDIALQGTNDLWGRITANGGIAIATVTTHNFSSSGEHVFAWLKNITFPKTATKANGGCRVIISSDTTPTLSGSFPSAGPTNSKSWYMGGSDTDFTTGWMCYVVDPTSTADLSIGTCDLTSIDRIGIGAYITGSVGGGSVKPMNIIFSAVRYGTGLTLVSGTGSAPAAFSDIFAYDMANARCWGICCQDNGIYLLAGKINIGTTGQTAVTVFRDTAQTFVWRNFPVASGFYEILVKGASGYKTTFRLGDFSPATGLYSNGCSIKGSGTVTGSAHSIWKLTASDSNQVTKLYGCNFSEMLSAALAYNAVSFNVTNCTTTNNDETVTTTGSFDTSGVVKGMLVTGTGIPDNTYVASFNSATSIELTNKANASGTVTLTFAHNNILKGCNFSNFGTITTNGCQIEDCVFQDLKTSSPISATYGLIVASATEMARIKNSKFINCNRAIKITTAGEYAFDNLKFSGNTYDIENSSSGAVTIQCSNGANPSTYINTGGGSVSIVNTVILTLTGLVADSEVRIYTHGTTTELDGIEECDTTFEFSYTYAAGTYVDIVVHKADKIYYRVNNYLLPSSSATLPISQQPDRQYSG